MPSGNEGCSATWVEFPNHALPRAHPSSKRGGDSRGGSGGSRERNVVPFLQREARGVGDASLAAGAGVFAFSQEAVRPELCVAEG